MQFSCMFRHTEIVHDLDFARHVIIIIIIIASHDNEMNNIYNDKIYMRRSDTMKRVRIFKVPATANHTSKLMEYFYRFDGGKPPLKNAEYDKNRHNKHKLCECDTRQIGRAHV